MTVPYQKSIRKPTEVIISRVLMPILASAPAKESPVGSPALTRRVYGLGWALYFQGPNPPGPGQKKPKTRPNPAHLEAY
jgi:hypothetical protein